jgi:hypothetical protein
MKESLLMMNLLELPPDFPHKAPEGYSYYVQEFKRNVVSIWLLHHAIYSYSSDPIYTIWGFVKFKTTKRSTTHTYHAPINSNKVGKEVCIRDTRPHTAMQLNLNPLEAAFFS